MNRTIPAALSVLALLWGANFASAQFTLGTAPPRVRPTVNPAINLGAGGAFSYYGYIKPQADATRSILNLQQTLNHMNPDGSLQGQFDAVRQQGQQPPVAQNGLQTGHPVTYFNYSHYYPVVPPGGGTSIGAATNYGGGLGGLGSAVGFGTNYGATTGGFRPFFAPVFNVGGR